MWYLYRCDAVRHLFTIMCLNVKTCCGCINLNLATKIIGILSVFSSGLITFLYAVAWYISPVNDYIRKSFYGAVAILAFAHFLCSWPMTLGAFKGFPRLLWPWVVVGWCWSVGLVVTCTVALFSLAASTDVPAADEVSSVTFVYFIFGVVQFYLTCVVNSRRLELEIQKSYSHAIRDVLLHSVLLKNNSE